MAKITAMQRTRDRRAGQSITEAMLLLPLYLFFALAVLQIGQLGAAILMANYAASSIARKAANEQTFSAGASSRNLSMYQQKAKDLMIAGMQFDGTSGIQACTDKDDPQTPTEELTVAVRTKLPAWPFFGDVLHGILKDRYSEDGTLVCPDLTSAKSAGPFNFSGSAPYYFFVTGKAKIRLNYIQ